MANFLDAILKGIRKRSIEEGDPVKDESEINLPEEKESKKNEKLMGNFPVVVRSGRYKVENSGSGWTVFYNKNGEWIPTDTVVLDDSNILGAMEVYNASVVEGIGQKYDDPEEFVHSTAYGVIILNTYLKEKAGDNYLANVVDKGKKNLVDSLEETFPKSDMEEKIGEEVDLSASDIEEGPLEKEDMLDKLPQQGLEENNLRYKAREAKRRINYLNKINKKSLIDETLKDNPRVHTESSFSEEEEGWSGYETGFEGLTKRRIKRRKEEGCGKCNITSKKNKKIKRGINVFLTALKRQAQMRLNLLKKAEHWYTGKGVRSSWVDRGNYGSGVFESKLKTFYDRNKVVEKYHENEKAENFLYPIGTGRKLINYGGKTMIMGKLHNVLKCAAEAWDRRQEEKEARNKDEEKRKKDRDQEDKKELTKKDKNGEEKKDRKKSNGEEELVDQAIVAVLAAGSYEKARDEVKRIYTGEGDKGKIEEEELKDLEDEDMDKEEEGFDFNAFSNQSNVDVPLGGNVEMPTITPPYTPLEKKPSDVSSWYHNQNSNQGLEEDELDSESMEKRSSLEMIRRRMKEFHKRNAASKRVAKQAVVIPQISPGIDSVAVENNDLEKAMWDSNPLTRGRYIK